MFTAILRTFNACHTPILRHRAPTRALLLAAFVLVPVLDTAATAASAGAAASTTMLYSTFTGTASTSVGTGVGTDRAGNIYVEGTAGTSPKSRVFVTKYDPTGSRLLYATYISAPCGAAGNALAVDAAGNAYVTGQYGVPNQYGICQETTDVLGAKLDPSGHVIYQKAIGPTSKDDVLIGVNNQGEAIAVDQSGSVYITGRTDGDMLDPSIPITAHALQPTGHAHDGFVLKLDPAGNIGYSTFLGGGNIDEGRGIAVDSRGDAYVTGSTQSRDFPTTAGAYQPHIGTIFGLEALGSGFVAVLNPTGTSLLYSTYLGGGISGAGNAIATDGAGNVFVTGATDSPNFPTTAGAYDRTCGTNGKCNYLNVCTAGCGNQYPDDVFVAKFAIAEHGSASLRYSTFLGGNFNDEGLAIAVDRTGRIYVAGRSTSPSGFPTRNASQPSSGGGSDAFVAAFDPARSGDDSLAFCTYVGGSKDDEVQSMALGKGAIFITGDTTSADFPMRAPAQKTWSGNYGAFLTKLSR